ncbi:hypothetical protein NDU88_005866, partial [Pleurodeles waltl]
EEERNFYTTLLAVAQLNVLWQPQALNEQSFHRRKCGLMDTAANHASRGTR